MTPSILLFVLFSFAASQALKKKCPPPENIAPKCICKDVGDGPMMVCNNMMTPYELLREVKEVDGYDMFSLAIHDSTLLYFPDGLFKNTNFKKIRLVGTELMSLGEYDLAFEHLEDTLEEFRVMEAEYVTQWTWRHLKNLHKLELMDVDLVSLGSISVPFPKLESLSALGISRGDITYIVDDAFKELANLNILVLKNNDISELKRSMFPDPANKLSFLDLSDNKLDTLPADIFHRMPNLYDVQLQNNAFTTIYEAAFSPIMDTVHTLTLKGNILRCDCRMRWIVSVRKPNEFDAVCTHPESLKGQSVQQLDVKDLWC